MKHAIDCRPLYLCNKCGAQCASSRYFANHPCRKKHSVKKESAEGSASSANGSSRKKGFGMAKEKRRAIDIKRELNNNKQRERKKSNTQKSNVFDFNDNEESSSSKIASTQPKQLKLPIPSKKSAKSINTKSPRKRTAVSTSSGEGEKTLKKQLKVQKKEVFKTKPKVKKLGYGCTNHNTGYATNKRKNNSSTSMKPKIPKRKKKLKNAEDTTPTEMSLSEENNNSVLSDTEEDLFTPATFPAQTNEVESSPQYLPHNEVIVDSHCSCLIETTIFAKTCCDKGILCL